VSYRSAVLAVVFDFDDTLAPDSTTKLLTGAGIDAERFWRVHAQRLVSEGYDSTHAYLRLLLDNVGVDLPLGPLRESDLTQFGEKLNEDFYPGIPELFADLRDDVAKYRDIAIEFYIISGGLQQAIEGSDIVKRHFSGVYGCLLGDGDAGHLQYIKRCVTFTEKTRFLFEINKGLTARDTLANPFLVNKNLAQTDRRVPFKNIIYIGDGLTDIPCFSLVKDMGGVPFGVFHPGEESSAKKAFLEILQPARVVSVHAPRYGKDDELGAMLRAAVAARCAAIEVERNQA
jgi:phosphoserine phosphatase